jgi:hypothetical protein
LYKLEYVLFNVVTFVTPPATLAATNLYIILHFLLCIAKVPGLIDSIVDAYIDVLGCPVGS